MATLSSTYTNFDSSEQPVDVPPPLPLPPPTEMPPPPPLPPTCSEPPWPLPPAAAPPPPELASLQPSAASRAAEIAIPGQAPARIALAAAAVVPGGKRRTGVRLTRTRLAFRWIGHRWIAELRRVDRDAAV